MNTGFAFDGFPSMGAWINYALGSESANLPAFVAIEDPRGMPQSGPNNWANGFLPAAFQGTPFSSTKPIRFLKTPGQVGPSQGEGGASSPPCAGGRKRDPVSLATRNWLPGSPATNWQPACNLVYLRLPV